jgi:hypothetical protein
VDSTLPKSSASFLRPFLPFVPEPASLLLPGTGLLTIGYGLRLDSSALTCIARGLIGHGQSLELGNKGPTPKEILSNTLLASPPPQRLDRSLLVGSFTT